MMMMQFGSFFVLIYARALIDRQKEVIESWETYKESLKSVLLRSQLQQKEQKAKGKRRRRAEIEEGYGNRDNRGY